MRRIILFDGECNLCNNSVKFILPKDKNRAFKFSSLQSDFAKTIKFPNHSKFKTDTLYLLEGDTLYWGSEAIIKIVIQLKFPWNLFALIKVIPLPIRDTGYQFVAKNRRSWFGKSDTCISNINKTEGIFIL